MLRGTGSFKARARLRVLSRGGMISALDPDPKHEFHNTSSSERS